MDLKKRKADIQLTPEESNDLVTPAQSETIDVVLVKSDSEVQDKKLESVPDCPAVPSTGFGFSAYSKGNPFAAAMGAGGFKNVFLNNDSNAFGGKSFGKESKEMPPPLVVPSPRSPKVNPFSTPSPVHNPFMTIVDSKDDLWQTMAKDKLSADEAAKSCFFGDDKYALKSSSSFGGKVEKKETADVGDDEDVDGGGDEDDVRAESPTFVKYTMPDVPIFTGEEQDECLLQVRAKLFRLSNVLKPVVSDSLHELVTSSSQRIAPSSDSSLPSILAAANAITNDQSLDDKQTGNGSNSSSAMEWVEVGIGPVKLLQNRITNSQSAAAAAVVVHSGRLVMRREEKKGGIGTKLLLNVRLDQFVSVTRQSEKVVRLICVNFAEIQQQQQIAKPVVNMIGSVVESSSDATNTATSTTTMANNNTTSNASQLQTYLLKTKTTQEADDLVTIAGDFVTRSKTTASTTATAAETTIATEAKL